MYSFPIQSKEMRSHADSNFQVQCNCESCKEFVCMQKMGRKSIYGTAKQQPVFTETVSEDMEEFQRRKLTKFKESAWKGLYYLTAELFALAVTYNEPWFTESKQFWVGPGDQLWPNQMTRYLAFLFADFYVWLHYQGEVHDVLESLQEWLSINM